VWPDVDIDLKHDCYKVRLVQSHNQILARTEMDRILASAPGRFLVVLVVSGKKTEGAPRNGELQPTVEISTLPAKFR
jgi:hypothetical protein